MKTQGLTKGSVGERLRAMYKDPRFISPNTDAAKDKFIADLNARVRAGALPAAAIVRRSSQGRGGNPARAEEHRGGRSRLGYYNNPSLDGKRPGIYWINLRDTKEAPNWTLPSSATMKAFPVIICSFPFSRKPACP